MTKEIQLTRGYVAIVDDDWFPILNQFKWYAKGRPGNVYAYRGSGLPGQSPQVAMARVIMNPPPRVWVDHRNGDGLDNRIENLRLCTPHENIMNRRGWGKSIYKGVFQVKGSASWYASIQHERKQRYLGAFKTAEEAAAAYNREATRLFGEFASLNVIVSQSNTKENLDG